MFELIYLKWCDIDEELVEHTLEFYSSDELYDFINLMTGDKRLIYILEITDLRY